MEVTGGDEAETIDGRLPASTTGGGATATQQWAGGNRGGVHRRAAQCPRRQRRFLELAAGHRRDRRVGATVAASPTCFQQSPHAADQGAGLYLRPVVRSREAHAGGVSAARSGGTRAVGCAAFAQPVEPVAIPPGLCGSGGQPALLSSAVAVGDAPVAQSPGGLFVGLGLHSVVTRGRPAGGRAGRLHSRRHQTLPASAPSGVGGGQAGGAVLVAPGQLRLRQQRGEFRAGSAGQPARPPPPEGGARRLGLLLGRAARPLGTAGPALYRLRTTDHAHPVVDPARHGVDAHAGDRHRGRRGAPSGTELALPAAAHPGAPPRGREGPCRRTQAHRCTRLSLPGVGHQSA